MSVWHGREGQPATTKFGDEYMKSTLAGDKIYIGMQMRVNLSEKIFLIHIITQWLVNLDERKGKEIE